MPAKTLKPDFCRHKSLAFVCALTLGIAPLCMAETFAQQNDANPDSFMDETPTAAPAAPLSPPTPQRQRKTTTKRASKNGEGNLSGAKQKQSALGLGLGIALPLQRPQLSLDFAHLGQRTEFALRLGGSYVSLSDSFRRAAVSNEGYSDKITDAEAYLWDLDLAVPELTFFLPFNLYVSGTPFARFSRCVSNYITTSQSPLNFSGWSLAIGAGGYGGYRLNLAGDQFSLDFFAGLSWPLWSTGSSEISYLPLDAASAAIFSETDLDTIAESLQVYMKDISLQVTTEAGIRAAWRF